MDRFATRRDKLRKSIKKTAADALLVTNFTNVTYLTGFTGDDSYLLVGLKDEVLISDPRYSEQLEQECPGLRLVIRPPSTSMLDALVSAIGSMKLVNMAAEADSMTIGMYHTLVDRLEKVFVSTAPGLVEELRVTKDREEIDEIRLAARYAEKAFAVLKATLRPEQTEKEVGDALENQLRLLGAKGSSFPPIIAVGPNAAKPHHRPSDTRIGEGDFVLVDWGATAKLYCSDLTRVLATAKLSSKLERVYDVVLNAQRQATAAIRPGVSAREVDAVARGLIEKAGFGKHFGHGLGHGIGLDIHEAPRLNAITDRELRPGMVVTVEPGIYLPGWGGVGIEDDVLVTKTGHEVLTNVPKELQESVVA